MIEYAFLGKGVSHLLLTFVDLAATSTAPAKASTISGKTEIAAGACLVVAHHAVTH
jgi:hypothetical protein